MSIHKLKDVARRGTALLGAVGLLAGIGTSIFPAFASADALNPLTERSLTLSSSSPGWSYLDGSGNALYAPPHSGANGKKTGDTFSYRMSSFSKTIKAITFQYCTTPAGNCTAPGNNTSDPILNSGATTAVGTGTISLSSGSATVTGAGTNFDPQLNVGSKIVTAGNNVYTVLSIASDTSLTLSANASATEAGVVFEYRSADTTSTSDLNIAVGEPGPTAPAEIDSTDWAAVSNSGTTPSMTPPANDTTGDGDDRDYMGNFVVMHDPSTGAPVEWDDYSHSAGWSMTTSNVETGTLAAGNATGTNNFITITNTTGQALSANPGDYFKIVFFGTDDNYITNPGAGAFFVRMNTYSDTGMTTLVDGGVTVANVMNESISIQTKVLETMDFSVGTHDPDTFSDTELDAIDTNGASPGGDLALHGQCNAILTRDPTDQTSWDNSRSNVLQLGDQNAEYSLKTNLAHDVYSYWRLSSNSSGGATVYYTGHTLTNTVGDEITPLTDTTPGGIASNPGTEQFGLAISQSGSDPYLVDGDNYGSSATPGDFAHYVATDLSLKSHLPQLAPLIPSQYYDGGAGTIVASGTAGFSFNANADTYAIPIATENTDVVDCVTAKMRYVANIAATTPAGIYTTKVNYVASPQY